MNVKTHIWFILAGLLYLLLHVLAVYSSSALLWGVDGWRYANPAILSVFLAICFLSVMPPIRQFLKSRAIKLSGSLAHVPFLVWIPAAAVLLYVFRERTLFLGDGYLRAGILAPNRLIFLFEEPLDALFHSAVFCAIQPYVGERGTEIYQWTSIVMGLFALWGVYHYGRRLFEKSGQRWFMGGLLASSGAVQLFFGYVESYTITNCCALLFILSGLVMLREEKLSIIPAIFLSLAIISHSIGILLIPGIVYAYYRVIRENSDSARAYLYMMKPAGIFVLFIVLIVSVFFAGGHPPSQFIGKYLHGSNLLPFFTSGELYGVFSWYHLADVLNELALIVPALVGLAFLLPRIRTVQVSRAAIFSMLCSIGPVVFMCLFNPKLGFARDWDIFSLAGFPLTVLCGILIIETTESTHESLFGMAFPLILVSLFHTVPWIWVNASEQHSLARFEQILETPWWPDSSRGYAHDMLASYYYKAGNTEKAIFHNEKSFDITDNKRAFKNVVLLYVGLDEIDKLRVFIQKDSLNPEGHYGLGMIYFEKKMFDRTREELEKARSLNAEHLEIPYLLGRTYAELGRFEDSRNAYEEALKHPHDTAVLHSIHNDLGCIYANLNMWDDARNEFNEALSLKPDYGEAYLNLAKLYYRTRNDSLAVKHAELAGKYGSPKELVDALLARLSSRR
ncbi:tetratricopeptide repeat protein [bacterium]|nr:tetratricopeptide repeat protein [bacterium]